MKKVFLKKGDAVAFCAVLAAGVALLLEYADCPDQICVKHAEISKSGSSIVCLPNKVVITVHGDKNSMPDGVAR